MKWISVKDKDKSPIINETILVSDGYEVFPAFLDSMHIYKNMLDEPWDELNFDVLFWMPLPLPPES